MRREHEHDHEHEHEHFDFHPGPVRAMTGGRGRGRRFGAEGFDPRVGFPLGGPGSFGGPGGFGGPGRGRGRGRRAGRGDVRQGILALLNEEPMHGYQIIQELAERSGGVWRPSPGSIYPTLASLEDEGLVRHTKSEGKRIFQLTETGQAAVADAADRPAPWDEVANDADSTLVALRDQLAAVAAATMQVAQAGNADQVAKTRKVLSEARRKIYLLLAEDEGDDEPPAAEDAAPPRRGLAES